MPNVELQKSRVTEAREVYPRNWVLWLEAPVACMSAAVGQFLMVSCGEGYDPLLPRALSIHRFREGPAGPELALLFAVVGPGTEWLSQRMPGDNVSFFGPLGHGFSPLRGARNLLLIAGGDRSGATRLARGRAAAGG